MGLFFEIMTCAMAVFGVWCALRLVSEACFASREIRLSVTVRSPQDVARLDGLLAEARVLLSARRGRSIVVLCDAALAEQGRAPAAIERACRRGGAVCCLVRLPREADENR